MIFKLKTSVAVVSMLAGYTLMGIGCYKGGILPVIDGYHELTASNTQEKNHYSESSNNHHSEGLKYGFVAAVAFLPALIIFRSKKEGILEQKL